MIDFTNCNLDALPEGLSPVLRRLYLPGNRLVHLPSGLDIGAACPLLCELDLSNNRLEELPPLGKLHKLRKLYLSNNQLRELPSDLFAWPSDGRHPDLRELWVEHNRLEFLPDDMSGCRHLLQVLAGWNCLTSLPDKFPPNIQQVLLQHNQLEIIPESVCLPHVNCLALRAQAPRSCRPLQLPSALTQMRSLARLLLGVNPNLVMPQLGYLQQLRQLYLADCGLGPKWPDVLGSIQHPLRVLFWLDVSDNPLHEFPRSPQQVLPALRHLDADGCSIMEVDTAWLRTLVRFNLSGSPAGDGLPNR